jgi:general secretion pathway protein G
MNVIALASLRAAGTMSIHRALVRILAFFLWAIALLALPGLFALGIARLEGPFGPDRRHDARGLAARTQLNTFSTALALYRLDTGRFPTTRESLRALFVRPVRLSGPIRWRGPYLPDLKQVPRDPWGNPYRYRSPGPRGEPFEIVCFGADGKPGGSAYDADLRAPEGSP